MVTGRIAWLPRYARGVCTVPFRDGRAIFNESVIVTDRDERQFPAQIRFSYTAEAIREPWPPSDWCRSLSEAVTQSAQSWTAGAPRDFLITDRRGAGVAASEAVRERLQRSGLQVHDLTVRFVVPEVITAAVVVPEIAALARPAAPVIFIGLDGADWELLDGYMAAGVMPNLAALVREGNRGVLKTQHPPLSPLLWNTMMTGVSPLQHRVLDFTRFHPHTGVKEPITADERAVPAIWNMATAGGKSVAVFGLWATFPAEPVRGLIVSDRFFTFLYTEEVPPAGVVFPPSRDGWARGVRQDVEKDIGFDDVRAYLPWLGETEFDSLRGSKDPYSHPVSALHRILVETEVYHSLATKYLRERKPDLAVVYFQGTDSIGHVFAPFNPPRQPQIAESEFEKYKDVAARYFKRIDEILGDYRQIAAERGAVLMLASDHGFRWHEGRPTELSSFAAPTAAKWHRDEGIYLIRTAKRGATPSVASIDQVCATLLSLTGLPADDRLVAPGLVSRTATGNVDYSRHYKPVPPLVAPSDEEVSEDIAKLRALGYIGTTEPVRSSERGKTRTAGSFNNEGLILRGQGKREEAIQAWENALRVDPNLASAAWNLSDTYHMQNRLLDRSDELLVRAFANGLPEGFKFLIGRAIGYQRAGQGERSLKLLEGAVASKPDDPELRMFRGRYRMERRDCSGALEDFRKAQELAPRSPIAFASAGIAEVCLGNRPGAIAYFQRALQIEPNQPQIRHYLESLQ